MPKDVLDIIDTAVKIGLGALISGIATYSVTSLTHNNEIKKYKLSRKRELLEEIASQSEVFSNIVLTYWAYMMEHTRYIQQKKAVPEDLVSRIEKSSKELFDGYSSLGSAEGKLILIGADKAQDLTRSYGEFVKSFRRFAWTGNNALTEKDLDDYRTQILQKRKDLYEELRAFYEN